MSNSINTFAAGSDLYLVLGDLERSQSVYYVDGQVDKSGAAVTYSTFEEIEGLGIAGAGDIHLCALYLIMPKECEVQVRTVAQRRGGVRHLIDQLKNPDSVAMWSGGAFEGDCVISGQLGTCTDAELSKLLMSELWRATRRHWRKIRSYWVGPEAEDILRNGGRLTTNIKSSEEYDLSMDA